MMIIIIRTRWQTDQSLFSIKYLIWSLCKAIRYTLNSSKIVLIFVLFTLYTSRGCTVATNQI